MQKLNRILWGVVLVAVGVVFALNALHIVDINIFFDGWWTLFIIIPCTVGLITEREKQAILSDCLLAYFCFYAVKMYSIFRYFGNWQSPPLSLSSD